MPVFANRGTEPRKLRPLLDSSSPFTIQFSLTSCCSMSPLLMHLLGSLLGMLDLENLRDSRKFSPAGADLRWVLRQKQNPRGLNYRQGVSPSKLGVGLDIEV